MGIWDDIKKLLGVKPTPSPADAPAEPSTAAPKAPSSAGPQTAPQAARAPASSSRGPSPSAPGGPSRYAAPDILGLTPEQLRKRALRINPFRTPWIGRVDTIPPADDERTALIDRGLELRGLLTRQQLDEIHAVGDLWLRHHDTERLAQSAAQRKAADAAAALTAEKAARKAEKQRLSAERKARRTQEIAKRRRDDIIYLGRGVSRRLSDRRAHVERLVASYLPVMAAPADVARALGLTVSQLRWLSFHAEAAERTHYVTFQIPKRSGGLRTISAPHQKLAAAQQWILANVLARLTPEAPAHGFVSGRSTVTNATPHLGQDLVINLDLSDFFPTITFPRVRGLFEKLGYSPAVATVLALLTTEAPRLPAEYDGQKYAVATGPRALPQGACTSPALSNQIARRLDRRLSGLARRHGWTYTRYADDLTFSAPVGHREELPRMLGRIRAIVTAEGFRLNPKKGRVQRRARRQDVTGIVVNDKPGLPRAEVRRLRAILHQAAKTGLEAQNREQRPHFEAWLRGRIAYLSMIDPHKGGQLRAQLDALTRAG